MKLCQGSYHVRNEWASHLYSQIPFHCHVRVYVFTCIFFSLHRAASYPASPRVPLQVFLFSCILMATHPPHTHMSPSAHTHGSSSSSHSLPCNPCDASTPASSATRVPSSTPPWPLLPVLGSHASSPAGSDDSDDTREEDGESDSDGGDERESLLPHHKQQKTARHSSHPAGSSLSGQVASFHPPLSPQPSSHWPDLSLGPQPFWTVLDRLCFSYFRHLLVFVLMLVLATGTLQYDLLHGGYLALALAALRVRSSVLHGKTAVLSVLRFYNFALIAASLVYQCPLFPYTDAQSCNLVTVTGLFKYDYGFRLSTRSALVDLTMFFLISLLASSLNSGLFRQVLVYMAKQRVSDGAAVDECWCCRVRS